MNQDARLRDIDSFLVEIRCDLDFSETIGMYTIDRVCYTLPDVLAKVVPILLHLTIFVHDDDILFSLLYDAAVH